MKYTNHIRRSEASKRMFTVWGGLQTTPYKMGGKDCSQYAVDVWNLSPHDYNTETFVTAGVMVEIPVRNLKPADAVGKCGPGTSGPNGHMELFFEWVDIDRLHYKTLEQDGKGLGPHWNELIHPSYYKAYRFTGIIEDMDEEPAVPLLYTIKSGDTLAAIARRHNMTAISLYRDNDSTIEDAARRHGRAHSFGPDVSVNGIGKHTIPGWWIFPGTVLRIYGRADA